jgi:tRNA (guanine26-N2/guanine27-N2)-dimethyltransferase
LPLTKYYVCSLNTQLHLMQELHDIPLFFSLHNIAGTVKCTSPSLVMFRSAVLNAGYRISSTHVNPLGVKSDAPWDVIWDIMRCWVSLDCSYIYHKSRSASILKYELVDILPVWLYELLNLLLTSTQVKNHPIKEQARDSPGTVILSKSPKLEVCCL